jgi:hypothetical protein
MCRSKEDPIMNITPTITYIHPLILAQLNGNIKAICEISKNSIKQVSNNENKAQNTINRNRPISGNKNNPTCTVPAEHSQARHAAEDSTKSILTIPVGVFK